jgi:hypothetical protein
MNNYIHVEERVLTTVTMLPIVVGENTNKGEMEQKKGTIWSPFGVLTGIAFEVFI